MTENTTQNPNPLRSVVAMESAVFRMGQIARQLVAEHPGLPLDDIEPSVYTYDSSRDIVIRAKLEMQIPTAQGARDWADAIGCEPTVTERETDYGPSTSAKFETVIDGVTVEGRGFTTDMAAYFHSLTKSATDAPTAADQDTSADASAAATAEGEAADS